MVNEHRKPFNGVARFPVPSSSAQRAGGSKTPAATPGQSSSAARAAGSGTRVGNYSVKSAPLGSSTTQRGLGLGKGAVGLGKGKGFKRHKRVPRDSIRGVTKGDIKRLARRGGIKRISGMIYDDVRQVMKERLENILRQCVAIVDLSGRKTVTVRDIIFTLNRFGQPVYGYDPSFTGTRK
ncbi:histone-fold-containing protein [Corynespora cassiicola Philippines]|uniref:Histone H4 n=1 Tax=Corynespora cassiicola Philippines TaxID=1448308 RepID=A0A2T2N9W5_CORCC|nr:histone-fold-containing protein [Corynespora cassiicola Philippines]